MNCDCPSCQCAASRRDCRNTQISGFLSPVLLLQRGALRDRHERWERDAMDAMRHQTNDVSRTAKSCGSGAPTLALSSRPDASHLAGDGGKKARSPGRSRISRNTIAQGMPVVCGVPVVATRVLSCCTRGYGCIGHPAFPAPSLCDEGGLLEELGRFAPRERDRLVHESSSVHIVPPEKIDDESGTIRMTSAIAIAIRLASDDGGTAPTTATERELIRRWAIGTD